MSTMGKKVSAGKVAGDAAKGAAAGAVLGPVGAAGGAVLNALGGLFGGGGGGGGSQPASVEPGADAAQLADALLTQTQMAHEARLAEERQRTQRMIVALGVGGAVAIVGFASLQRSNAPRTATSSGGGASGPAKAKKPKKKLTAKQKKQRAIGLGTVGVVGGVLGARALYRKQKRAAALAQCPRLPEPAIQQLLNTRGAYLRQDCKVRTAEQDDLSIAVGQAFGGAPQARVNYRPGQTIRGTFVKPDGTIVRDPTAAEVKRHGLLMVNTFCKTPTARSVWDDATFVSQCYRVFPELDPARYAAQRQGKG